MEWIPLIMKGRTSKEPIAATRIGSGTDVNFGALTRILFDQLKNQNVDIKYKHQVDDIKRTSDGSWELKVDNGSGKVERHTAKFIFIGGGGGSFGFPSSGILMRSSMFGTITISMRRFFVFPFSDALLCAGSNSA
jgi:malate dehydrogenase (quinone)